MVKFRLGVGRTGSLTVGLMGEPEVILLGDSVRVIGGDLSSFSLSCSRFCGMV